ncbi:MAG: ATP-binding protein, partial [Phycisphaerae bacterium]
DAADVLTQSSAGITDISRLRRLVRTEMTALLQYHPDPATDIEIQRLRQQIDISAHALQTNLAGKLGPKEADGLAAWITDRQTLVDTFLSTAALNPDARFAPERHLEIDSLLGAFESRMLEEMRASVDASFSAQETAALILSINMFVGAALGILGMLLVRRWVLLPVQELKRTTDELGRGNLEARATVNSADELGQLAAAVNRMSEDLARIERRLVQRERLAAMGELIAYVTHNIRNPLAGIRSAAESCRRRLETGSEHRATQDQIVSSIDKFQQWLRELEHSCSPIEVQSRPVDLTELIENVVTVFRPMSDRRSIAVRTRIGDEHHAVPVDARQFEQALAAVIGNAIEAVDDRGQVTIATESNGDPSHWNLTVTDTGPGIPTHVRDKVFEPSFSTKRNGHGLGLALAKKVTELHGGDLTVICPAGGGTVFRFSMPVETSDRGGASDG